MPVFDSWLSQRLPLAPMEMYEQMDFQILFVFLIFVLTLIKLLNRPKTIVSGPNLPPGPRKLPLLGNIPDLSGPFPHHTLRDLARKHGPLIHLQLGENSTVVASSARTAKAVMKTHDVNFANRPFLLAADVIAYKSTNIMFSPHGEYWRQLRRICNSELLSARRVQELRPIREVEVAGLVEAVARQAGTGLPIDLSEQIYAMTYGITTRSVFGKKSRHQQALISLIDEALGLSGGFGVADLFPSWKVLAFLSGLRPKLEKIHGRIDKMLDDMFEEHEGQEEQQLLADVLLKVQKQSDLEVPMNMDNIKAIILDILSAGSDTSSTVIEWAMSELLKNPTIMAKAQAEVRRVFGSKPTVDETDILELHFLRAIIKETLRLHPPAPLMLPMENRERCEIDGYEIPTKTKVIVNVWAIGRDPENWTDPERFHPERFLENSVDFRGLHFEFIPFGAGRRICPGILFGLANIELPLASLLFHFDWKLPDGGTGEDLDMTEAFGVTVKRKNVLNLVPIVYRLPST